MAERSSSSAQVQRHRQALRAAGLRPIQIWVPDTRRRGFDAECRRQSLLLRDDLHERDALNWLRQVADMEDWQ